MRVIESAVTDVITERNDYLNHNSESKNIFGINNGISSKNHFKGSDVMPLDKGKQLVSSQISLSDDDDPVDLRNVTVNREKPFSERRDDFIRQVHNPYMFRVGSTVVRVEFGDGKNFADILTDVILAG